MARGYGQFTDYTETGQPGVYDFGLANGSSMRLVGEPAEALRQRLDALKSLDPQPIAANNGAGGTENEALGMSIPDPAPTPVSDVPADASATTGAMPTRVEQPAPQAAAAPPPARPQAIASTKGGGIIIRDPSGQLYEQTPGSPGISREQLQQQAASGVALPSGAAESVEGGFAPNADYLEQITNANLDKKLALQRATEAQAAQSEAERGFLAQQAADQAQAVEQERARAAAIQARVDRDMNLLDAANAEYGSAKVDPQRVFSGAAGTMRGIGFAIADALGTYAALMTGGQNHAGQAIQRFIDRDIAAQEMEIRVKGQRADNALKRLSMSMGSLDQAKSALRIAQLEHAKSQASEIGARYGGEKAQAQAAATVAGLDEALAQNLEKYRQDSMGRHTLQVSKQFAYPKAGSAGARRPLTLETQGQLVGIEERKANVGQTIAQTEATKNKADGEGQRVTHEVNATIAKQVDAMQAAQRVRAQLPKGGGNSTVPGHYVTTLNPEGKQFQQELEGLVAKEQSAADVGSTEDDYQRIKKSVYGSGTAAEVDRGTQNVINRAAGAAAQEILTLPPAQREKILRSMPANVRAEVQRQLSGTKPEDIGMREEGTP